MDEDRDTVLHDRKVLRIPRVTGLVTGNNGCVRTPHVRKRRRASGRRSRRRSLRRSLHRRAHLTPPGLVLQRGMVCSAVKHLRLVMVPCMLLNHAAIANVKCDMKLLPKSRCNTRTDAASPHERPSHSGTSPPWPLVGPPPHHKNAAIYISAIADRVAPFVVGGVEAGGRNAGAKVAHQVVAWC